MIRKKNRKKLPLFAAFLVSPFIPGFLSAIGLFLSLWVIVPAPTLFLYPLAVGAPEISPWLVGINTIALLLNLLGRHQGKVYIILLICNLFGPNPGPASPDSVPSSQCSHSYPSASCTRGKLFSSRSCRPSRAATPSTVYPRRCVPRNSHQRG